MNNLLIPIVTGRTAVGLLIIRVFFGLRIPLLGYGKITQAGPLHWGDSLGIASPLQGLATLSEFGGGLAIIAGLLTPLAALGLTITMLVAIFKVHLPQGEHYISNTGAPNYEVAGHYLIVAVGLLFTGPGTLSLDALIFRRHGQKPPNAP